MAISTDEARTQILDDLAAANDRLALAVACLGEAFELLDVMSAERMEDELYRPIQKAYGRGKRTHSQFAERVGLPGDVFETPAAGRTAQGARSFLERATEAAGEADRRLADLQDSMLPIEAGDAELRAGLGEMRELLGPVPTSSQRFLSMLGR
jgi:hypothetical protein